MVYRYTLPPQRSPYACQQRELSLRSQTISNAIASSPALKRASLYAYGSASSKSASRNYQSWVDQADKENVKIATYPVSSKNVFEEDSCQYDPADPTTWGIKPLPPLPRDSESSTKASSIMSKSDDDAAMLQSPVLQPYSEPDTPSHNLAQLIGDHLRINDDSVDDTHHRTTSSSYHDPESEPSRVQSPIPNGKTNMLSVTNLAKYGKTNDRLSNLRSGSPSSAAEDFFMEEISDPQYDSSLISRYRFASSPGGSTSNEHVKGYDGAYETVVSSRPSLAPSPSPSVDGRSPLRRAKRRASQFSLRSLSKSFTRPRLGFRRWANSVYRESSRRFNIAKQKIKQHAETERRDFAAWKAQRRKSKATEAQDSATNGHHKNHDWWKEGMAKYQASKLGRFQKV
ncbi:hypothetical protein NLG97_g8045 [Lecanicillium saksenae]|uniref:Uncharacterized protein n=1 Tax=Lecanicillium saksenae TaxID=468837 RepID=A0ACC1QMF7_9HYPO|nr:hypothetical protein NLG97_g8045 [Lecanicillium saksenae]